MELASRPICGLNAYRSKSACPVVCGFKSAQRSPLGGSLRHGIPVICPKQALMSARLCTKVGTRQVLVRSSEDRPQQGAVGFGYSRKDVVLIGVGLIALGYISYYGLQAAGVEPGMAGNFVQLAIFLGICVGWISSYLWRVANKKMTYAQQLEDYEEAVMQKRLEEMPVEEVGKLIEQVEEERQVRQQRAAARRQQQEQQQK